MTSRRWALLLPAVLLLTGAPALPAAVAATPTAGQSTYVPVAPVRLFDTRDGTGGVPVQRIGPGGTLDITVTGINGVPATATAVVLNVTATRATAASDIRVYPTPSDASFPTVSNLNVVAGSTVANLVTVKVGDGGRVRLRNASGLVDLLGDLSGYFVADGSGTSYAGTTPVRLLDTRVAGQGPAFGAGEVRTLAVRGSASVPSTATAVALNVTAVSPTAVSDLRLYPTIPGQGPPTVSNLNPIPGRVTTAAVVVAIGGDGTISIRNAAGSVHVVVDLQGWYAPGTDAGFFHPLAPRRLLDTRSTTALGPGETRDLTVAGTGAVPFPGSVVVLNVTALSSTGTDVRVYPARASSAFPNTSNVNPGRGATVPNTVLATVGDNGAIRFRNATGSTHLVVDLSGWFGPAGDGWDISWPQCDTSGGFSQPPAGAFAVIGVTHQPFHPNPCFAQEYAWADALPGGGAVYINADAPGTASPDWARPGPRTTCDPTSSSDIDCGWNYGWNLAGYALGQLGSLPDRPQVFLDVENGTSWSTAGVNGNVVIAAINRLRAAGYRVGIYSNPKDWSQIMGGLSLPNVQNWTFVHTGPTGDAPATYCTSAMSFTGGDNVLRQLQPSETGLQYDVDHPC